MNAESDRQRWDRKYAAGEGPAHFEPKLLLTEHRRFLTGDRALDVGCGFGGNALYLASLGYQVDAVDVSGVALALAAAEAKRRGLLVQFIQADLGRWWLRPAHYDLITVFFYLNRELMSGVAAGLSPGGLLFQANRNRRFLKVRPSFNRDYLLEPGELRRLALDSGLKVIYYGESPPGVGHSSQLIAQRAP
jgi:SAM-dependent methyltransferase